MWIEITGIAHVGILNIFYDLTRRIQPVFDKMCYVKDFYKKLDADVEHTVTRYCIVTPSSIENYQKTQVWMVSRNDLCNTLTLFKCKRPLILAFFSGFCCLTELLCKVVSMSVPSLMKRSCSVCCHCQKGNFIILFIYFF